MATADTTPDPHPPGEAVFEFGGQSYRLPAVTLGDRKAFHAWCNSRAIAEVTTTALLIGTDDYTEENYQEARDTMLAKVGSGHWAPGKPGYRQKLVEADGLSYLCWVGMARLDRKLKLEQVRALVETQAGFDALWAAFQQANANPTAP